MTNNARKDTYRKGGVVMGGNVRIEQRLTKTFVRVVVIAAVAAVIALIALGVAVNRYSYALTHYGFAQGDIGHVMVSFADARSATRGVIGYTEQEAIDEAVNHYHELKTTFDTYWSTLDEHLVSANDKDLYSQVQAELDEYWAINDEIVEEGASPNVAIMTAAQHREFDELDPLYDKIYTDLEALMQSNVEEGDKLDGALHVMSNIMIGVIVLIIAGAVFLAIKMGKETAQQISTSLNSVAYRLQGFSEGDLSSEFPQFEIQDEVNDMAMSASSMADNLHVIMEDLSMGLQAIADGNFLASSQVPEMYVGEFEKMRIALESFIADMRDTLLKIDDAAEQVDAGSCQLAESAIELAEGATDQAGAIQEITATITHIADNAQETADQVGEAYQNGLKYRAQAERSNEEMDNLASAMERISEASEEIRNIIGEIEDIAAQTNLLSLNASIEAARAGEAGKGFAVVADQIGKLAMDSAQSAVRTKELIQRALQEVENGNEITKDTKQALEEVVEGIEFLSNASKHASESSASQVVSLREVELAVEQISGVVQSNSAAAEETSATSEELAAQATSLRDLISNFELR
ncbi:MAG: methyl-accepting chemotaxis protein [Lachnospiraceae bacterium]|nr:methyl-accepting chemotaxis protein [Lachnospiraceae bacterium]